MMLVQSVVAMSLLLLVVALIPAAAAGEPFPFVIPWEDEAESIVDVSDLNPAPLDESRRVAIKDGHFYDQTGRRVRFVGTNLAGEGCFPSKEDAVRVAARFHRYGINCVRLAGIDATNAAPNIFYFDGAKGRRTDRLDPESLDRLDYLIYQFKLHGIYVDVDLRHYREWTEGDGFPDRELVGTGGPAGWFEPKMIARQKLFAKQLLTHYNPYTKTRYVDEPAVAYIELTNEDTLLGLLQARSPLPPHYRDLLAAGWNRFLREKYRTTDALREAWSTQGAVALAAGESLEAGTIPLASISESPQGQDFAAYLIGLERDYSQGMKDYITHTLQAKAPVTCSQPNFSGLAGVWRESNMDWVDTHAYYDLIQFPNNDWDANNYHIGNTPMVQDQEGGVLAWIEAYRVAGKPFTVGEYDHGIPNEYGAEMVPMVFAYAAWQDWDGVFFWRYHARVTGWEHTGLDDYFDQNANVGKFGFLPAAAELFLRGSLSPAPTTATLLVPKGRVSELVAKGSEPTGLWLTTPDGQGPLTRPEMITRRLRVQFVEGNGDVRLVRQSDAPTDTELTWSAADPAQAQFTVRAPRARVAIGRLGGRSVELGGLTLAVAPSARNFASLVLTSRDGQPIEASHSLLLTVVDKVENAGLKWNADRTFASGLFGVPPALVDGVAATLSLQTKARKATVYALSGPGSRSAEVPSVLQEGRLSFTIGPEYRTIWYEIAAE